MHLCTLRACVPLQIFGLIDPQSPIGFTAGGGAGEASREEVLTPVLDVLAGFREVVRNCARTGDTTELLRECDRLRDEALLPLGVRLEDGSSSATGKATWKLEDPEVLRRELAEKQRLADEKAAKKLKQKQEAERKAAEKAAKARIPPNEIFLSQTDKYSQFDAEGMPTHDVKGEPLSKGALKKVKKEFSTQESLYKKHMAAAAAPAE